MPKAEVIPEVMTKLKIRKVVVVVRFLLNVTVSAQTTVRAATLRENLQIKLDISPSQCFLIPGEPVPSLTAYRQASARVATGVPILKSLV